MDKKSLLTIGQVSQLTGINAKSLRYYEKIGILKPALIDSETKYRYYSYSQLALAISIRTFITMEIPLNNFSQFIDSDSGNIQFLEMIEYGKTKAKEEIKRLEDGIQYFSALQYSIERYKAMSYNMAANIIEIPEKFFFVSPVTPTENYDSLQNSLRQFYYALSKTNYRIGFEYGIIHIYKNNTVTKYKYVEILNPLEITSEILLIPSGKYISKFIENSCIDCFKSIFPNLPSLPHDTIVIESSVFPEYQNIYQQLFELRVWLR